MSQSLEHSLLRDPKARNEYTIKLIDLFLEIHLMCIYYWDCLFPNVVRCLDNYLQTFIVIV